VIKLTKSLLTVNVDSDIIALVKSKIKNVSGFVNHCLRVELELCDKEVDGSEKKLNEIKRLNNKLNEELQEVLKERDNMARKIKELKEKLEREESKVGKSFYL
jgi:DNA repair ATPase RecN